MGNSCCPYENSDDKTIRENWHKYKDQYSQRWSQYFGCKWDCSSKEWKCHGNWAHGATSTSYRKLIADCVGRLFGIDRTFVIPTSGQNRGRRVYQPGTMAAAMDGKRINSRFLSLESHMEARNAWLTQHHQELKDLKAELDAAHRAGTYKKEDYENKNVSGGVDLGKPIGVGAWRLRGELDYRETPKTSSAWFSVRYDPISQTFYETTGFPQIDPNKL